MRSAEAQIWHNSSTFWLLRIQLSFDSALKSCLASPISKRYKLDLLVSTLSAQAKKCSSPRSICPPVCPCWGINTHGQRARMERCQLLGSWHWLRAGKRDDAAEG